MLEERAEPNACANPESTAAGTGGSGGTVTFHFDAAVLEALDLRLIAHGQLDEACPGPRIAFGIEAPTTLEVESLSGVVTRIARGSVHTRGAMLLDRPSGRVVIGNLMIEADSNGALSVKSTLEPGGSPRTLFELESVTLEFQRARHELHLIGDLALASSWAAALDLPKAAGAAVGTVVIEATIGPIGDTAASEVPLRGETIPERNDQGFRGTYSDVVVADLQSILNYGGDGTITAFAVGTNACNFGTGRASWVSYTNQHPVIAQNAYRLMDDRFEQIGLSWVKHGFYAVSESFCTPCNDPTDGTELGVGCSDPYSAGLNGIQSNMSPRSIVDPNTGYFPDDNGDSIGGWPICSASSVIDCRLQIHNADLVDPGEEVIARYFVQGHYLMPDDAFYRTHNNNASYREVMYDDSPLGLVVEPSWPTRIGQPAVRAWQDVDGSVDEVDIQLENEGLFILAAKPIFQGEGVWRYSYALQNLNSDRGVGSFSVPLPYGATVSYTDFHDVDHHSGEPYDLTDWTIELDGDSIRWYTETFATRENANALRYGTLYNFYFDVDVPPGPVTITLGLFKPGTPSSVTAEIKGPNADTDCNTNGIRDKCDIDCGPPGGECDVPGCGESGDCTDNGVADECEIEDGIAEDVNSDGIPDECQVPNPLALPSDPKHQARKHRYLSIDPTTNPTQETAIRVEVAEMRRCQGDLRRLCLRDSHCSRVCENDLDKFCTMPSQCGGGACIETGPCINHTDEGLSWIVQQPFQEHAGCIPSCTDEDWIARVSAAVYAEAWSVDTLHIGECQIIPGTTYNVYACDPLSALVCSEPLIVATQVFPSGTPPGDYGDVVGTVQGTDPDFYFTPPDGSVNVTDVAAWLLTMQNYGSPVKPQAHPTWMDIHGLGTGIPPNFILNVNDLTAVYAFGFVHGWPWVNTQGGLSPGDCP
ncbi:MAG: hypothetical protein ACYTFA_06380 [Planctomycetota bacterium]|jgi:hypothetical protein